jgi:hypothetical protein
MHRFHVPAEYSNLTVNGREYVRGEDGTIEVHAHEDHHLLKVLGCHAEGDEAPIGQRVEPSEPPPLPDGYVSEEVVRGLVEENEDQRKAIEALNTRLENELQVANGLRARIQELEGQLAARDAETATEDTHDEAGAHEAPAVEDVTETRSPGRRGR